jgi:hypothetical protein
MPDSDYLFVLEECGLIERIPETVVKTPKSNIARWWAEGTGKNALVIAHCDACRQSSRWFEATDSLKIQHCGKTEVMPKEIFEQYKRLRNTW